MKKYLIAAAVLTMLAACRKEIDINYKDVEPLYVIESYISDGSMAVLLTTTRDMKGGEEPQGIEASSVEITSDAGFSETLEFYPDGIYRSPSALAGTAGDAYTLRVVIGEDEFVSTSVMHPAGRFGGVQFRYEPSISTRYMICTALIADTPDIDNYYRLRILKNGNRVNEILITDRGRDGTIFSELMAVRFSWTKEEPEEPAPGEEETEDRIFRKGDALQMVLETIDRPVYDYFYSLSLVEITLSNPLTNIEGGCLGYFSAYSTDIFSMTFDPEAIRDGG